MPEQTRTNGLILFSLACYEMPSFFIVASRSDEKAHHEMQ
jgi:hypothetical protein